MADMIWIINEYFKYMHVQNHMFDTQGFRNFPVLYILYSVCPHT
jgi:hypothetical protein